MRPPMARLAFSKKASSIQFLALNFLSSTPKWRAFST
jgi:hypothetical protein